MTEATYHTHKVFAGTCPDTGPRSKASSSTRVIRTSAFHVIKSIPPMSKTYSPHALLETLTQKLWVSGLLPSSLAWMEALVGAPETSSWIKLLWTCASHHPPLENLVPLQIPHVYAAKSFQSCLTLCDPIDGSPPGSPCPGILQARILEWVAISFSNAWKWKMKVKLLSRVQLLVTPWTAVYQAPPSMGFSRQEYWSGVPLPSPPHLYNSDK